MNRGSKYVSKTHAEFCTKCIKKWSFFVLQSFFQLQIGNCLVHSQMMPHNLNQLIAQFWEEFFSLSLEYEKFQDTIQWAGVVVNS